MQHRKRTECNQARLGFSPRGIFRQLVGSVPKQLSLSPAKIRRKTLSSAHTADVRLAMEKQDVMAVDSDEAYVSGNLSSGSFPSIGDAEKAAPSSPRTLISVGSDIGGERRKISSKRSEGAVGKGLSQRRKGITVSRRVLGTQGENSSVPVSGGTTTSVPLGSLPTPTTQLSRQIDNMGLVSPLVVGKRTLAERADDTSPMSDTDVVVGTHSLNDPGYGSLPHGPSSLEQPTSLQKGERGRSGSGTVSDQRKDVPSTCVPSGMNVCIYECMYVYVCMYSVFSLMLLSSYWEIYMCSIKQTKYNSSGTMYGVG